MTPVMPLAALALAQFDHLGLVVKSLHKGRQVLAAVHGVNDWTQTFTDPVNGVHILFGRDPAGMVYELLEPIDATSPVYGAMTTRKNLLNHVAYRVHDLAASTAAMRAAGCAPIGKPQTAIAFGNGMVQFFVSPLSTIIELIEAPGHAHAFGDHRLAVLPDSSPGP